MWSDDRFEHFIVPKIEDYPDGYPRLAAKVNSDNDCMLFRRFAWMRHRVLLYVQDELQVLEGRLSTLDQHHDKTDQQRLYSRRADEGYALSEPGYTRLSLMKDIKFKLEEYDWLVQRTQTVASVSRPSTANFKSFFNWIYNEQPLYKDEFAFMYHKDDFMALGQRPDPWFSPTVDSVFSILPKRLKMLLFSTAADRARSSDPNTTYYSDSRGETVIAITVNIISVMLLVLPVVLLYLLETNRVEKVVILVAFVSVFNVLLSTLTRARRYEVFTASAAYCAVLVVFLGTMSQPGS